MAHVVVTTTARVEVVESIEQLTSIAAESITPGMIVRLDTSNGKFTAANGSSAAEARVYGVAVGTHTVIAGLPVTAVRRGVLDGFTLTDQAWDCAIYADDTDGMIGDAAGTVSVEIGRVIPSLANLAGVALGKMLYVAVGANTTHTHA